MSLPHHKLVVWQRADDLFIEVHRLSLQHFPSEEKFELGRQLRRSAYSVPANIVEGNARQTDREQLRFFNIASGSLNETEYGLHAAHRLGYLTDTLYDTLEAHVRAVAAPLNGLIRAKRRNVAARVVGSLSALAIIATQVLIWLG